MSSKNSIWPLLSKSAYIAPTMGWSVPSGCPPQAARAGVPVETTTSNVPRQQPAATRFFISNPPNSFLVRRRNSPGHTGSPEHPP